MNELNRILINAGLDILLEETIALDKDDALFIVKACRDWLERKRALENFQTTGNYKADLARREGIEEEMAHIQGLLLEYKSIHGFGSVNNLFNAAKEIVVSESAGVGVYDPRSNKTADVGPDTLQKMASRFGNKVTKGGIPPMISKDSWKK